MRRKKLRARWRVKQFPPHKLCLPYATEAAKFLRRDTSAQQGTEKARVPLGSPEPCKAQESADSGATKLRFLGSVLVFFHPDSWRQSSWGPAAGKDNPATSRHATRGGHNIVRSYPPNLLPAITHNPQGERADACVYQAKRQAHKQEAHTHKAFMSAYARLHPSRLLPPTSDARQQSPVPLSRTH